MYSVGQEGRRDLEAAPIGSNPGLATTFTEQHFAYHIRDADGLRLRDIEMAVTSLQPRRARSHHCRDRWANCSWSWATSTTGTAQDSVKLVQEATGRLTARLASTWRKARRVLANLDGARPRVRVLTAIDLWDRYTLPLCDSTSSPASRTCSCTCHSLRIRPPRGWDQRPPGWKFSLLFASAVYLDLYLFTWEGDDVRQAQVQQ